MPDDPDIVRGGRRPVPVRLESPDSEAPTQLPRIEGLVVEGMTELQGEGMRLARMVLWFIFTLAASLLLCAALGEQIFPPKELVLVREMADEALKNCAEMSKVECVQHSTELLTRIGEIKRASREFWMGLSQLLLLNLLLPVLTSILGYVFGTSKARRTRADAQD